MFDKMKARIMGHHARGAIVLKNEFIDEARYLVTATAQLVQGINNVVSGHGSRRDAQTLALAANAVATALAQHSTVYRDELGALGTALSEVVNFLNFGNAQGDVEAQHQARFAYAVAKKIVLQMSGMDTEAIMGGDFDYSMIPDAAAEIAKQFIPKPKQPDAAKTDASKGGGAGTTPTPGKGGSGGSGAHEEKSSGWLGVPYWVWALGGVVVIGGTVFLLRHRGGGGGSGMLRLGSGK